jgi:molybdopterin converting factor small subunit
MSTTVTVKFFANVEILMGRKEVSLVFDDSKKPTVGDAIREVTKLGGKDLGSQVMDGSGKSLGRIRIVVNGELLHHEPFGVSIHDGDEILVFPLLAGG